MQTDYTTRKSCRVCGSEDLTFLFSLGTQYVSNFVTLEEAAGPLPKAPLDLELCAKCGLVQLKHTAPQELLYTRHYWYRSGVTDTMRRALREVSETAETMVPLSPSDVVLDIGSNDGTLLRSYHTHGIIKVGVEPATNLKIYYDDADIDYLIDDFWSAEAYLNLTLKQPKIVTALGMFYDLEDPNQFIADIAKVLAPDGLFIAQLMCLANMLDSRDIGNICHEHLEYYSYKSLKYLFESNGLEIFDIESNLINGGSYRLYARHKGASRPVESRLASRRLGFVQYHEQGFHDPALYQKFYNRMEENKTKLVNFLQEQVGSRKRCWVYGASTKGNTILQYCGLDTNLIEAASDRSPEKWGKYTVGSMIPIRSEEQARNENPDYFLVLPYAFIREFVEREKQWHSQPNHAFIVPLPEFRLV